MSHPKPRVASSLHWSGWTDRGKVRPHNEDSFVALQFDANEVRRLGKTGEASTQHNDFAFAVSDGMGGAMAGEFASRIAVEKITTLLPRSYKLSAQGIAAGIDDVLGELFDQIHKGLVYVGNSYEECRGMETTLSLCWFTPGWMYFGHVGDSRIYFFPKRAGGMKQLTQDDTHVAWLLRNGHIKEWEARTHPRRNVLQKSLGGNNQFVEPQLGAVACEPGDMFLLCTDGLTEGIFSNRLEDLLRHPEPGGLANIAQSLVDLAVTQDGRDNTTALVIEARG
jgi:serine/threonine protein phosphatase PrpC